MSTGWTPVEVVAELLVAFGTLALAWKTRSLAKETHALAEKGDGQVAALIREAKATEELAVAARTDRLLTWRPQLELRDFIRDGADWYMTVKNSGAGPALDVVVVARNQNNIGEWALVRFGDLRPGDSFDKKGETWAYGKTITSIFEEYLERDDRRIVTQVMMCTDVLGQRFRFGVADPKNAFPGEPSRALPAEVSIPDPETQARSPWASEPLLWG
jgi:hypothetical protein